jgi:hypothetical protein
MKNKAEIIPQGTNNYLEVNVQSNKYAHEQKWQTQSPTYL